MIKFLLLALLAILPTGCDYYAPIRKKPMARLNSTSYVLAHDIGRVRAALLAGFPDGISNPIGLVNSKGDSVRFEMDTSDPRLPEANDFHVNYPIREWTVSRVYTVRGHPIETLADYEIHLDPISDTTTTVSVVSSCLVYTKGMLKLGDHDFFLKDDTLAPTTVEEYTILLYVGKQLHETNMPPLIVPNE